MTQDTPASETLSDSQLNAPRNLAERQPGRDSNFVNISAARGARAWPPPRPASPGR